MEQLQQACDARDWSLLTELLLDHPQAFKSGSPSCLTLAGLFRAEFWAFCCALPKSACLPGIELINCLIDPPASGNDSDSVPCLTAHPGLSHLSFNCTPLDNETCEWLAKGAQRVIDAGAPGLQVLKLRRPTDSNLAPKLLDSSGIAKLIRSAPHLKHLALAGQWLGGGPKTWVVSLSAALMEVSALSELHTLSLGNLTPASFTSPRVAPLLRQLARCPSPRLTTIELVDCNFGLQPLPDFPNTDWADGLRVLAQLACSVPGRMKLVIGRLVGTNDFLRQLGQGLGDRTEPFDLVISDDPSDPEFDPGRYVALFENMAATRSDCLIHSLTLTLPTPHTAHSNDVQRKLAVVINHLPALQELKLNADAYVALNGHRKEFSEHFFDFMYRSDEALAAHDRFVGAVARHPALALNFYVDGRRFEFGRKLGGWMDPEPLYARAIPGARCLLAQQGLDEFQLKLTSRLMGAAAGASQKDVAHAGYRLSRLNRVNYVQWMDHWNSSAHLEGGNVRGRRLGSTPEWDAEMLIGVLHLGSLSLTEQLHQIASSETLSRAALSMMARMSHEGLAGMRPLARLLIKQWRSIAGTASSPEESEMLRVVEQLAENREGLQFDAEQGWDALSGLSSLRHFTQPLLPSRSVT